MPIICGMSWLFAKVLIKFYCPSILFFFQKNLTRAGIEPGVVKEICSENTLKIKMNNNAFKKSLRLNKFKILISKLKNDTLITLQ